jgi:hypothetical protein
MCELTDKTKKLCEVFEFGIKDGHGMIEIGLCCVRGINKNLKSLTIVYIFCCNYLISTLLLKSSNEPKDYKLEFHTNTFLSLNSFIKKNL